MNADTSDLSEEIHQRQESTQWDLHPCPCCHAKAHVFEMPTGGVRILCGQWECRTVEAANMRDATTLWNSPRFSQGKP